MPKSAQPKWSPLDWSDEADDCLKRMFAKREKMTRICDALALIMSRRPSDPAVRDRMGKIGLTTPRPSRSRRTAAPVVPADGDDDGLPSETCITLPAVAFLSRPAPVRLIGADYRAGAALRSAVL